MQLGEGRKLQRCTIVTFVPIILCKFFIPLLLNPFQELKMKIKDVIQEIEKYAPLNLQETYDNAGVQVGNISRDATGVLLSLDITEEVIEEAYNLGCNIIVVHHPLIFKPLSSITGKTYIERCIVEAIQKEIVIYAAHTNLDNVIHGVSHRIAQKIGLQNICILSPDVNTSIQSGSGVIGELFTDEEELSFLCRLKDVFELKVLKHSPLRNKKIKRVAICGGSGAFLIQDAITAGADIFVTGEAKYNDFYDVEKNILLSVIGHYESEVCTKEIFFEIITKKFPNFAVHFSNINSNPVNYL